MGDGSRYDVGGGDDGLEDDGSEIDVEPTQEPSTNSRDTEDRGTSDEIPHRVRHDSPKTDRKEVPFVLGDDDRERLSELQTIAEREFDETVFKMDVYLGSLRAGLYSSDEAFLSAMEEIGYGYFDQ